jgi:hypothetical protein
MKEWKREETSLWTDGLVLALVSMFRPAGCSFIFILAGRNRDQRMD